MTRKILLLHGGAGSWNVSSDRVEACKKAIGEALDYGWSYIDGSALEAVVESLAYMEDTGLFNAGSGSVLNLSGYREMDAGVMDGCRGYVGAVACTRYPKNPIRLAYIIARETDHLIVCGDGADSIAKAKKLEPIGKPGREVIDRYKALLDRYRRGEWRVFRGNIGIAREAGLLDTIGAVALDENGCLAAGVSTGGVWLKLPGRIGDSAIPGAGFYADKYVAIAASGIGEYIILTMPGLIASQLVRQGYSLGKTLELIVDNATRLYGRGCIGVIGVSYSGEKAIAYNTRHFLIAWRDEKGSHIEFL